MNSKSLRRLAADHGSLHSAGLPPNYLFPPSNNSDDLTSLDVLLAGPTGTPYENGVWRLHLEIPPIFPQAPPTATFRTRLWHPNIDEATGAVCVETLKRDWVSTLKLRDVLVTISCLLIQPNPASALNEAAGKLASEDWDGFCRRARLMTEIHAAVPKDLVAEVKEAQSRGDDPVMKEAGSEVKNEAVAKGKGKEKAVDVPKEVEKKDSLNGSDEENRGRRSDTAELSDEESDWIPRPTTAVKPFTAGGGNAFGIKGLGLDDSMDIDTPVHKVIDTGRQHRENSATSALEPFPAAPKSFKNHFSLRVQATSSLAMVDDPRIDTPADFFKLTPHDLLAPTHPDYNSPNPLLSEFSWSWQDSEVMKDTGTIKDGPTKDEVRKRLASSDFEKQRKWEMKKFKKAGYDLKRYNRGDWGPKTGIFRL